jgi:hypothetical protein
MATCCHGQTTLQCEAWKATFKYEPHVHMVQPIFTNETLETESCFGLRGRQGRWKDDIKMDLRERYENMTLMDLAQGRI